MLTFERDGKSYTLRMTRAGARAAEDAGLSLSDVGDKPLRSLDYLFYAALYADHRLSFQRATALLEEVLDAGVYDFATLYGRLAEDYAKLFGFGEPAEISPTESAPTESAPTVRPAKKR